MDFLLSKPLQAIGNTYSDDPYFVQEEQKPTDSKVKGLVLHRIGQALSSGLGALLPSAIAPKVVYHLLASFHLPTFLPLPEERISLVPSRRPLKRQAVRRSAHEKFAPIGLTRCEPYGWINGLMQFLLFLPGSSDLFSLIPKSFQPLREFADQYFADQEDKRSISLANSAELTRFLIRTLPAKLFLKTVSLYDILLALFPTGRPQGIESILLKPACHIAMTGGAQDLLEVAIQTKLNERPPELLIGLKGHVGFFQTMKRQIFCIRDAAYYDLDAFIELRPDGAQTGSFITYVKVDGAWYQCDDDRIVQLRSNCMNAPLLRTVLLHYRRIGVSRTPYCKLDI